MSTERKGILVVLSGFSGAGKGTIVNRLMEQYGDRYALSISATTRAPRQGEQDGAAYFFLDRERFEAMIAEDAFIEYAEYVNNYYGTPKEYVQKQLSLGKSVILEIEMQGALQIREKYPDTRLLFVTPPSAKELKKRLTGRGTDTEEVICARLSHACKESGYMSEYDYLVINDALEDAVEEVHRIISSECNGHPDVVSDKRISANTEFIQQISKELLSFSKGD